MAIDRRAIAARLKLARESQTRTQAEIATELGYPQATISKVESGDRGIYVEEIANFSAAYRVNTQLFIEDKIDINSIFRV
jgi:transcriptional regulator with XRE-family HTH domain